MHDDYGYSEEGRLGKPYNLKLLARLAPYARPYKNFIALALTVSVLGTLLSLAVPYVTRYAIDRYITADWLALDLATPAGKRFFADHPKICTGSADGRFAAVLKSDASKAAPELAAKPGGAFGKGGRSFHRVRRTTENRHILERLLKRGLVLSDGSVCVQKDAVAALTEADRRILRSADARGAALTALLVLLAVALSFGLGYLEYNFLERAGQNIMADVRMALFDKMEAQSPSFFDRHPVGRLTTRVTNDVENLNEMFKSVIVTVFKDVFILFGIMAVLLALDLRLALLCFILIPLVFFLALGFGAMSRDAFRDLRSSVSRINSFCQERFSSMRTVQLFSAQKTQMERFGKANDDNYRAGMRQIKVFALFMPVMELLASAGVALLVWRGGLLVMESRLSLGTLVAFITYLRMFFAPLRDLSEKYNIMQLAMASTERIFEFMDANERLPDALVPARPEKVEGGVEFRKVSFSYSPGKQVLEDVSFTLPRGTMTALVGRTGSGKTTCAHLLERFYDPAQGRVMVDGIDLRDWDQEHLRRSMALVSQDVFLFSGTIRENVTLGRDEEGGPGLDQALALSGADFVGRFPLGADTPIAERGVNLSGGERQLLSFARALFQDPKILILDEATSSVDPATEAKIQQAVARMAHKRSMLVVAHRLSTIENADLIVVMRRGRVAETGTHQELMDRGGVYSNLRMIMEGK
ncbi:MAG: ABC transporter ATP-binding protein [Deltaproteobacteria bacterium]|nr:ABC transporter ATP-binding protein [Deltaproteobacteria bacterium]